MYQCLYRGDLMKKQLMRSFVALVVINGIMIGMENPIIKEILNPNFNLEKENSGINNPADKLLLRAQAIIKEARETLGDMAPEPPTNQGVGIDALITYLNDLRAVMNIHQTQADPKFVENYIATITANFDKLPNFDLKKVYTFFGFKDTFFGFKNKNKDNAVELPYSYFTALSDAMLASDTLSEDDKFFLRQCGTIFRYKKSKKLFDTYLTQGKRGLQKLKIDSSESENLLRIYDELSMVKAELEAYKRRLKLNA